MKIYSLNGKWSLKGKPQESESGYINLSANVPGEVQLDLSESGYLPKDLYKGMNITETEKFEEYEWWYEKKFFAPEENENIFLCFEGVDCLAEYYLNSEKIGESANAFIPFEFNITDKIRLGENTLQVHLKSPVIEANSYDFDLPSVFQFENDKTMVAVRRPSHSYGWDIMPRAVTSGIWRDVYLKIKDKIQFKDIYLTFSKSWECKLIYNLDVSYKDLSNTEIEIEGKCKDSFFKRRFRCKTSAGLEFIPINNPKLWWSYGYGESNIYAVKATIYKDGLPVHETEFNYGHRSVELERTETTDGIDGCFRFIINGKEIMCKGTNWVPLDAFHSRDKQRLPKALELMKDIGCNIVRCWGGNVYESDEFFDFCDKNGIMVWQDFAMACAMYPQNHEFLETMRKEAESVVKRLRQHPSLVLWSGDNEVDLLYRVYGQKPSSNKITRQVLPETIEKYDTLRPYLQSSPYLSDELFLNGRRDKMPENHLWGSRDYFKSDYYKNSNAHFVSEEGFAGCCSFESLKKFINEDKLWPYKDNCEWILHSSNQCGNQSRVLLTEKQVKQLFGEIPEDPEMFIKASQISQAEAYKFFIEHLRVRRPQKSGIIWWNLIDGWPQISDAVVDYYYDKKPAYEYIKKSQAPFAIIADDITDWNLPVYACNDTLNSVKGTYSISDMESGEVLIEGKFEVPENSVLKLCSLQTYYSEKKILLIKWEANGKAGQNHYLCGYPAFDLNKYINIMKKSGFLK